MRLASYLFHQGSQRDDGGGIAGAILANGSFDSPAFWQLLEGYHGRSVPMSLWSSELDPVESGMAALKDRLCSKFAGCPMFAELKGHNRVSAVMSFDSTDFSAMGPLIQFYHSAVRK